jgi:toluene monooxygenase electron transfer component
MTARNVTITDRAGAVRSFAAPAGARILHVGLLEGIGLPHECGTGTCGMCKARLDAGELEDLWPEAPGRKSCRRRGEILMCQSAAATDVALTLKAEFTPPPAPACQRMRGTLREIDRPTPDILRMRCTLDQPMAFLAGQFALVELPGIEGPRAWSMTNHDTGGRDLDFLLRRAPDGAASAAVFDALADGVDVKVIGPLGRATFDPSEDRPFVAIAGGSGIAGMLAIASKAAEADALGPAGSDLIFGLRDPGSAYLLDDLDAKARASTGALRITVAFSDSAEGIAPGNWPHLTFAKGFAHDAAAHIVDRARPQRPIHYVAGPPVMVDATLKALMTTHGVAGEDIRYDRFG